MQLRYRCAKIQLLILAIFAEKGDLLFGKHGLLLSDTPKSENGQPMGKQN